MKGMTLAASLISAGLATIITAKVVEKKVTDKLMLEFDERVARELQVSVKFLEDTGKAEATEEYEEKRAAKTFGLEKPSLDEVAGRNEKIRYDQIIKGEGYSSSSEVVTADDGTMMMAEVQQEGGVEVCETLPDIHAIGVDEFMENESGFLQSSVTYFADGGVLDEHGELVVAHQDLIGNARPPFGELSGEPHIVYLRNTKLRQEFEVIEDDANAADILVTPGSPGDVT